MSSVPASMGYGQQITVQSPDAASIQKVTLIRLPSVTHSFDQNQRMTTLQFTPGTGTLNITAPANANLAPPGHYMLFIVNGTGVPSVAAIVQIGTAAPPPTAPALGSLAPSSATAGGAAFTLTANGSNFVSGATVQWNGAARTTTFVSATQLSATIAAADIAAAGTAQVSVLNPGGAASGALPFTITAAPPPTAPTLGSLAPSSATAGGPAFTLTANGSNFVSGATVQWNGAARTTTFVSGTQLRAAIAAADIAAAGTAQVSVLNPGGAASGALPFTVTAAPPPTGSGTWLARPNQCDCRRARLHTHRQWQQFRFGVGGAVEWRGPHDDLCQCHSVESRHSRGRHRRRGYRPGLGAQPWRSRVRCIAFHRRRGRPGWQLAHDAGRFQRVLPALLGQARSHFRQLHRPPG